MNAEQEGKKWSKSFCLGFRLVCGKQVNTISLKLESAMLHYLHFSLTTAVLKVGDVYENIIHVFIYWETQQKQSNFLL